MGFWSGWYSVSRAANVAPSGGQAPLQVLVVSRQHVQQGRTERAPPRPTCDPRFLESVEHSPQGSRPGRPTDQILPAGQPSVDGCENHLLWDTAPGPKPPKNIRPLNSEPFKIHIQIAFLQKSKCLNSKWKRQSALMENKMVLSSLYPT